MMTWFRPLLLMVGVLLYACPGAAESIQRYVDEHGTIHIGNVGPYGPVGGGPTSPSPPAPVRSFSPGPSPAPAELTPEPGMVRPPAPVPQTEVAPPSEAEDSESVLRRPDQGVTRITHQPVRKDGLERVAANPAGPPGGPPCPAAAAAPPASGSTIRRFKDEGGVIRITNAPALEEGAVWLAAGPPGPGEKSSRSGEVAWSLRAELPISRYQDRHGVIHITNEPISQPQPVQLAANPSRESPEALKREDLDLRARLEKVAFSPGPPQGRAFRGRGQGGVPPARLKMRGPPQGAEAARAGSSPPDPRAGAGGPPVSAMDFSRLSPGPGQPGPAIHRYRDRQGVIHIANLAPAGSASPWSGAGSGAPGAGALMGASAGTPAGIRPPPAAPLRLAASRSPPDLSGAVSVRRDRQGKIYISNVAPPVRTWDGRASPQLEPLIVEAARGFRLPVSLVLALIKVESNFVPWAVSPKGAMGLMQLMPETAGFLGVRDPFCPRENILAGCRYLRLLLDLFNDSLPLALAAYNAGHQRVVAAGYRIPPIQETQEFVTQVLGLHYLTARLDRRPWS